MEKERRLKTKRLRCIYGTSKYNLSKQYSSRKSQCESMWPGGIIVSEVISVVYQLKGFLEIFVLRGERMKEKHILTQVIRALRDKI